VIVVNPGSRSRVAADKIRKLGLDVGIKRIVILGNRVRDEEDKELIQSTLSDFEIIGYLPEDEEIINADRLGRRPFDDINQAPAELFAVASQLMSYRK